MDIYTDRKVRHIEIVPGSIYLLGLIVWAPALIKYWDEKLFFSPESPSSKKISIALPLFSSFLSRLSTSKEIATSLCN